MLDHYRHGTGTFVFYCVYRYRPREYRSQVLSVVPRTETHCRPRTSHYIVAVSANLKDSLYVTKETSIILFQLGAVNIFTFSPLNVNWTFRSDPSPHSSPSPLLVNVHFKFSVDLHRFKPLISLVPFNLHLHCFQG